MFLEFIRFIPLITSSSDTINLHKAELSHGSILTLVAKETTRPNIDEELTDYLFLPWSLEK